MSVVMGGDWSEDHDFSHIWKDPENKDSNIEKKNLNGMSKRLTEAIDVESAYRAYVSLQTRYNGKYGINVSHPDDEVKRLKDIINNDNDNSLSSKKSMKKTSSTLSNTDLLI